MSRAPRNRRKRAARVIGTDRAREFPSAHGAAARAVAEDLALHGSGARTVQRGRVHCLASHGSGTRAVQERRVR